MSAVLPPVPADGALTPVPTSRIKRIGIIVLLVSLWLPLGLLAGFLIALFTGLIEFDLSC
jgi:hypothetical protein